jgi:uncharacterized membrane protein
MEIPKPHHGAENSMQRIEAFSDGVFAIAITLLVIEIKVPNHSELKNSSLAQHLLHYWPKYAAYVFSFFTIGIFWANHHHWLKLFRKTNHVFNLLNVFFLMCISFLPFPTAVLGDYITDPAQKQTAVTFYTIGIFLPAIGWLILWLYASHKKRLLDERLSPKFVRYLTRLYLASNCFYFLAIIISLFNPNVAIIVTIILAFLYLFPPKRPQYV